MKKTLAFLAVMISLCVFANDTTKLYNPIANVARDVAGAVKKAKEENKHVLIQVGGNWCIWCYRFNDFVESDKDKVKTFLQNWSTEAFNESNYKE